MQLLFRFIIFQHNVYIVKYCSIIKGKCIKNRHQLLMLIKTTRRMFMMFIVMSFLFGSVIGQEKREKSKGIRVMTIPISIFAKKELRKKRATEFVELGNLVVKENNVRQTILSIRSVSDTPISLAILIQDGLNSGVNLQLKDIEQFIRGMPDGSRVMVAYIRGGAIQVRQKFTKELYKAAKALRIVSSSHSVAPRSPYKGILSVLKRFDGLPTGRRAILLVSDGLDVSRGLINSSPFSSVDLDMAILKAQRRGVAVYSFYSSATHTKTGDTFLVSNGQASLNRLSTETGGRAFFQGVFTPVSYVPFFRDLSIALSRQFTLTYLSTNMEKGYYNVEVIVANPEVKIRHPKRYYYREIH